VATPERPESLLEHYLFSTCQHEESVNNGGKRQREEKPGSRTFPAEERIVSMLRYRMRRYFNRKRYPALSPD